MNNLQQREEFSISTGTEYRLEQRLRRYIQTYAPRQSPEAQRWLLEQIYRPRTGKKHRERMLQHYPKYQRPAAHECLRAIAIRILCQLNGGAA